MDIKDYNVGFGNVTVWFTYKDVEYEVVLHTANVSGLIEKIMDAKDDWVEKLW